MRTKLFAFLFLVLAPLFCSAGFRAEAAVDGELAGSYKLLKDDGSPTGFEADITEMDPFGNHVMTVWRQRNGEWEMVAAETAVITPGVGTDYHWENMRGVHGSITYVDADTWLSEVETGPNAGTVRRLARI